MYINDLICHNLNQNMSHYHETILQFAGAYVTEHKFPREHIL